jgi:biotin carboxyl carrier protein
VKYKVNVADKDVEFEIVHSGDTAEVVIGDRRLVADLVRISGSPVYSLLLDGQSYEVSVHRRNGRFDLALRGEAYHANVMDERAMRIADATGESLLAQSGETILAPMPGIVVALDVSVGDTVEPGQGVVTLEAMKMENELKCAIGGVVRKINVEVGKGVSQGEPLVVIE